MAAEACGFAPAKVNLALHLKGLRPDGYHLLESLVVFADVGDRLTVKDDDGLRLAVSGPMAAGVPSDEGNLVLKAARLLQRLRAVDRGAAMTLEKHLPHGGGIGGGSSDAATAIRLLARLWAVPPLTAAEALPLGADLPVCLKAPAPMLVSGMGEVLTPAPRLPPGWLVLVNPGVAVPTGPVFKAYDAQGTGPGTSLSPLVAAPEDLDSLAFTTWLAAQRNDLAPVACDARFAPVIGTVLHRLRACAGLGHADMSGSGSTCWAWFATQSAAQDAASVLRRADHGWWVVAARVLQPDALGAGQDSGRPDPGLPSTS